MRYVLDPVPKPRMTQRDKWCNRPCVVSYRYFCDAVRLMGIEIPECGAHVTFFIRMPSSWSSKKKAEMLGKPHQQKPDIDNLQKALLDALFDDDSHIWDLKCSKRWGEFGSIKLEVNDGKSDC